MSTGAVYCVYEALPTLKESVDRIYHYVDKIVFLINFKPWLGESTNQNAIQRTYNMIASMQDPLNKFEIISKYWSNEASQRNYGLKVLRDNNIDWCLIVDDDEFFNKEEIKNVTSMLSSGIHSVYLISHQIYWKNRETIIEDLFGPFPTIIKTDESVHFTKNRMVLVNGQNTWFNISPNSIVCHHLSYVRSDKEMLRKIKSFSHANEVGSKWYDDIWLKWNMNMEDLHPENPTSFKRAIPVNQSKYQLNYTYYA